MTTVSGRGVEGEGEEVTRLYRLTKPLLGSTGLNRIPCGVCPVREEGREEGGGRGRRREGGGREEETEGGSEGGRMGARKGYPASVALLFAQKGCSGGGGNSIFIWSPTLLAMAD